MISSPTSTRFRNWAMAAAALVLAGPALGNEPWLEVGDLALRSDVEILAARGLIDGPTTTWPLPHTIMLRLSASSRPWIGTIETRSAT